MTVCASTHRHCNFLQFKGVFEHFITYFVRFISFFGVKVY